MIAPVRRWAILAHRYLGIALCVLFLSWFLSGIVMIYARGMPEVAGVTRLERMPLLNPASMKISAQDAATRADRRQAEHVMLLTVIGRPAFRFGSSPPVTVFADTGERLQRLTVEETVAIATRFTGVAAAAMQHAGVLTQPDQWTLGQRRVMPLHKLVVGDGSGTVVYVSEPLGEVVMTTSRASRRVAWISAIPHWLYFAALRRHDRLWASTVLWTSGLGVLLVLLGSLLGILQYRARYRGLMRWHYWLGVMFGAFALTWVFSGFLSMQPGNWASTDVGALGVEEALSEERLDLSQFPALTARDWEAHGQWVRELELVQIQGKAAYVATGPNRSAVIAAAPPYAPLGSVPVDSVIRRIKAVSPTIALGDSALLSAYDAYYYDREGALPLPILRLRFADSDRTWAYIDLRRGRLVRAVSKRARLERWLYHGLHSLDFPFLYDRRPLWDGVVIGLLAGGAFLSATAVTIAFKRVFR